jgi:hypothetical protein
VAESEPRLGVSLFQVVGSALAAVTAAVIASTFGVGGTVIGAALASVVATTATAIYTNSLRRANQRLLTLQITEGRLRRRPGPAEVPTAPVIDESPAAATMVPTLPEGHPQAGRRRWPFVATVGVVFVLAMGVVTGVEGLLGRPLSSLFGGGHDKGTSVGRVLGGLPAPAPAPHPSPTTGPTTLPSPTGLPSPSPSSPAPTPSPSVSPFAGPSASSTPPPTPWRIRSAR